MSLELMWSNLINYCLQVGLLIGLAAFLPAALRLAMPRARLAFWHTLLAACLLLPLLAPKQQRVLSAPVRVAAQSVVAVPGVPAQPTRTIPWTAIGLALMAGGAAIRLAWLCAGLWRLRQYRRRSQPLDQPASWSVEADLRISEDVASPVTFGIVDPVILLPPSFPAMDPATQDAILCHEVLHVRRKDWLVTVAEEVVRCGFWFHPAIWWLLGEIGLAREQTVDQEVVEMTSSREKYVDALLAIAGAKPHPDLAPAPLFLRKRHLKQRVVSILKEARMSKTRSISALAASLALLAAACWFVTMTVPLAAAPQAVMDGAGVTVDAGGAALMHRGSIMYPPAARSAKVEGTVVVEALLDGSGNVIDARVLSGPNELRRGVLQSVLTWHFVNDSGGNTRQIRVTFQTPAPSNELTGNLSMGPPGGTVGGIIDGVTGRVPAAPSLRGKTLKSIRVVGLSEEAKSRLIARLPVREGDILSDDSFEQLSKAVREYDEHMNVMWLRPDKDGGAGFMIVAPGGITQTLTHMSTPGDVAPPENGAKRITIGGNVQSTKLVSQTKPVYPPLARQARISGTVKLAVIIGTDGTVRDIRVVSGHPLLIAGALDAVREWRYSPTLLNGEPVEVSTSVDVNFTLLDEPGQQ